MAFFDNPKVDKISERSEKSVLETKLIFCRENGFISREENPDYGVDLDVELIKNCEATRHKFAIQIKSSIGFNQINIGNNIFLTIDFLTSRLGYLARNNPGLGLIVIYDESLNKLFYQFIEEIIAGVNSNKKNLDWLEQERVRIYIPIINELNSGTIHSIYSKFLLVHNNHNALLIDYADKYQIPYVNIGEKEEGFNLNEQLKLIEKYGVYLFNNLEFSKLYNALNQFSYQEISRNSKLSFLAALVYSEVGKCIDSNMFLQYCEIHITDMTETERDLIRFTKYKNEYYLGKVDFDIYINELKELVDKSTIHQNKISIKINIALLNAMKSLKEKQVDSSLLKEFIDLHDEIDKSDLEERNKHFLNLFQAENYNVIATKIFTERVLQQKLKDNLSINSSLEERIENAKYLIDLTSVPAFYAKKALDFSIDKKDKLLEAHALHKASIFFFSIQLNALILEIDFRESNSIQILRNCFNYSINAFKVFGEINQLHDAYLSICLAYEAMSLGIKKYNEKFADFDLEYLVGIILELEKEIGKKRFESVIDSYYQEKEKGSSTNITNDLINLNEDEINYFAESIKKAYGFTGNRYENLKQDILNNQYFYKHCDTNRFYLNQTNVSGDDIYLNPTDYVIITKSSNIVIGKGTDLKKLIDDLGLYIEKTK